MTRNKALGVLTMGKESISFWLHSLCAGTVAIAPLSVEADSKSDRIELKW